MRRPCILSILPIVLLPLMSGCHRELAHQPAAQSATDLMIQYGCPTCHVIPHVPGAIGKVGPPLNDLAQRSYLAGSLPNSPENLKLWIMHPQHFEPGTAMPEMGVSSSDAQTIAAYLQNAR
jgi:cytochrome c